MCAADGSFCQQKRREKRPANPLEVPPKLAELVLSHETTKMQANLLSRGEDIFLREYALAVAIDAAVSIHIMVTNRSDPSWVRIVPDRDMSIRPMSCSHLRDRQRSIEGCHTQPASGMIAELFSRLARLSSIHRKANQGIKEMNSSKKSASFFSGSPTGFLAAWQMRKTWCKRHFFAGRKSTPPKSSPSRRGSLP